MIDIKYTQYGGVENYWLDTSRAVRINPNGLPEEHRDMFENIAVEAVNLVNHLCGSRFYYGGHTNFDPDGWSDFDFIGVCFNPVANPAKLGSALLVADFEKSCWKGGRITMFPKAFAPKYTFIDWLLGKRKVGIRESVFNVFLHEFVHILGVDHTSIAPSLMTGNKVIEYGFGLQAWDLAVATKFKSHKKGSNPGVLTVVSDPHVTNRGRYLTIPALEYRGKMYSVSLQDHEGAWGPMYFKRWDKAGFDNPEDYNFTNIAILSDDKTKLTVSDIVDNGVRYSKVFQKVNGWWV